MLEHNINMFYIFFLILRVYENIIKVNNIKNIKKSS